MSGVRLTLGGMLGLIGLLALGLASVRIATPWWTTIAASATYVLLMTAVLGAIHSRDADRAYWTGFALLGITYLLVVNADWAAGQFGHDLTRAFGEWAEEMVDPLPSAAPGGTTAYSSMSAAERSVKVGNVVQITRMFLSLAFAGLGGLAARRFSLRARRTEGRPVERLP